MKELRKRLKHTEPYLIEKDLLPTLYFKEDENDTEYWIFYYSFIRGLSDMAIGVRLGYDRHQIYRMTIKILENNITLINKFLYNIKVVRFTTI